MIVMGIDSWETEGPRTFTDSSNTSSDLVVHVMKGTNPDTSMVPGRVTVHEAEIQESIVDIKTGEEKDRVVCTDCKRVTHDVETLAKVDKLEFRESDWIDDFFNEVTSEASKADREDMLDEFSKNSDLVQEAKDKQEQSNTGTGTSDNHESEESSGLMSYNS